MAQPMNRISRHALSLSRDIKTRSQLSTGNAWIMSKLGYLLTSNQRRITKSTKLPEFITQALQSGYWNMN